MPLPGSGRIFSGSRIRTPLGKWDSRKSPQGQGFCRAVADPDFQIRGVARSQMKLFSALRASVWTKCKGVPPLDPPLIGKENGFQEKDDRSSGYGFVVKKKRECGLRTPTPPPPPPCRRWVTSLVSFPQLLAKESNISFTHFNENKNNKFYWDSTYK